MIRRREVGQRGSIDILVVVKALIACLTYGSGYSSHDDVPDWYLPDRDDFQEGVLAGIQGSIAVTKASVTLVGPLPRPKTAS